MRAFSAALTCDEEVGSRLTVGGLVPHVDKILPCPVRRPKICHLTIVDDADLVEYLIELFARLVERDDGGNAANVRAKPERANELECR